jgi:hypothetical protein
MEHAAGRRAEGGRRFVRAVPIALVALAAWCPQASGQLQVQDGAVGKALPEPVQQGLGGVVSEPLPEPVERLVQDSPAAPVRDEVRRIVNRPTCGVPAAELAVTIAQARAATSVHGCALVEVTVSHGGARTRVTDAPEPATPAARPIAPV